MCPKPAFFRNRGDGTFDRVATAFASVAEQRFHGVAVGDDDGDGRLDLYLAAYRSGALLHNDGGKSFSDATAAMGLVPEAWGMAASGGRTLGVHSVDLDEDGQIELLVANDLSPGDLFVRAGDKFDNRGMARGVAYSEIGKVHAGMGVDSGDSNRDGKLVVLTTAFEFEGASLYQQGTAMTFADTAWPLGIGGPTAKWVGFGTRMADFDNDGWLDILVANGHPISNAEEIFPRTTWAQPLTLLHHCGGRYADASAVLASIGNLVGRKSKSTLSCETSG